MHLFRQNRVIEHVLGVSACHGFFIYYFEQNEIDELNNIQNYDEVNN